MSSTKFLLVCLASLFTFIVVPSMAQDCTSLSCVSSFIELESCLLANTDNVESLLQAFYPTNRFPALWVEARYYISTTSNKTLYDNSTMIGNTSIGSNSYEGSPYIFYWVSSPVLVFIPPLIMRGASLQLIQIEENHVARLVIPPFCSRQSQEDDSYLQMINNMTVWLKSYTVQRGVSEGLDTSLQGYVLHLTSTNPSQILVLTGTEIYTRYETQIMISLTLICFVVFTWGPYKLLSLQKTLHEMSRWRISHSNQKFRFKSILWSFIISLAIGVVVIVCVDIHFFVTFVISWDDNRRGLFYALIAVMVILFIVDAIFAAFLVWKSYKRNRLIEVPRLLLCMMDKTCSVEWINLNFPRKCIVIIVQFVGYLVSLVMLLFISLHGCGIVLALLAHPVQALSRVILILTLDMTFVLLSTYVFEEFEPFPKRLLQHQIVVKSEKLPINNNNNNNATNNDTKNSSCYRQRNLPCSFTNIIILAGRIITSLFLLVFLYLFMDTYFSVVLFVGNDSTGVVNAIAQIFPALGLSFLGWIIKKEYDHFNISAKNQFLVDAEIGEDFWDELESIDV